MTSGSIVESTEIAVVYVAGDANQPIPAQAPLAFSRLEQSLSSLHGRRFFGVALAGEYRACVAIGGQDDLESLPHPSYTIPGGRYIHRRLKNWGEKVELIGQTVEQLMSRSDYDPSRPVVEVYRSHTDLVVRVPVR